MFRMFRMFGMFGICGEIPCVKIRIICGKKLLEIFAKFMKFVWNLFKNCEKIKKNSLKIYIKFVWNLLKNCEKCVKNVKNNF